MISGTNETYDSLCEVVRAEARVRVRVRDCVRARRMNDSSG